MKLSAILLTMFSFARHVNSLSHSVRLATRAPLRLQSNSVQYGGTTHVVQSTIDPKNTALLLIEYQNEFVSEGGKLHPAVKPVMEASGMLRNSESVVDQARKKGVKIFHAPIMFTENYSEIAPEPFGILGDVKAGTCFVKGTWGAEFSPSMQPLPGDRVVDGKRGLCAFASTNLDFLLRHNDIQNLVLAGFLTNCCVESTMRAAYEKGYNVITLTDCTATTSPEAQTAAITFTYPMFSRPMTHTALLDAL